MPEVEDAVQAPTYHPVTFALQGVIAQSNAIERELARLLGLNATDYRALSTLQQLGRGGTVTIGRLGAALGTTAATTSAIADRLERAGYAVRSRTGSDRRQVVLETTALAWTRIIEIMRPLMDASDAYIRALGPDEAAVVGDFLRATLANLTEQLDVLTARAADR